MKIMIAGGLGYIGSALCELYRSNAKLEIIVLDKRFVPERVANLPDHMRFIQADIRDTKLMRRLLEDVDLLYLLAAEVEAEKSIHKERAVWEHNFEAPKGLIESCPPSTRIMFPSTGNVFGGVDESDKFMGLTEKDEPQPKYPYAETKRAMEEFLLGSDRNFVIVRFGTNHGYAPGIRFNLVTNLFVHKAMVGEDLTVHGAGENYRPTVCTKDCARALDFLSTRSEATGEIFHVVRENFMIKDLAREVVSLFDTGSKVTHIAKEVPFSAYALNSDKIQSLGFDFQWDLKSSVKDMQRVFRAMLAPAVSASPSEEVS
jgi:UDP-glucose 4-epimerase